MKPAHQITAKCETTIPRRTETIIPGIANGDNNFCCGLIDYRSTDNNFIGVLVASSLVDVSRNVIPVRVINMSDKARVIKEGEMLAACAPVTCINRNLQSTIIESSDNLISKILQSAELDIK